MTHAMTTRLRRYFLSPSNEDVLAFHEGFSDLVAIFQHFSFPSILREALQRNRGQLDAQGPLVELAVQFGQATGERHALRRAIDKPDVTRIRNEFEPHNRGAILVAAVFDAFLRTYQDRTQDLARIATGGAGLLGQSAINSDLADRLAREAVSVATAVLRMCIRAFDYLPPVDVTFGDYLRAMVTADFELNPNDENGLRRQMVEAFMIRGIFPSNISSISEESLRWPRFDDKEPLKFSDARSQNEMTASFLAAAASSSRNSALDAPPDYYRQLEELEPAEPDNGAFGDTSKFHKAIHKWAVDNSRILQLSQREKISVAGVHPSFRIAQDGQLLVEMIIQLVQEDSTLPAAEFGGVPFRGGTTLIVKANGLVQYVIAKPIASQQLSKGSLELAERRQHSQRAFVAKVDDLDAFHSWRDEEFQNRRIVDRVTLAAAHRGLSW
jgi:hypothetical protein